MESILSFPSITPTFDPHLPRRHLVFRSNYCPERNTLLRCQAENSTNNSPANRDAKPQNGLLKVAWYASEFLGIAASFLRSPKETDDKERNLELAVDGLGKIDRAAIVDTIKEDFQRSYFVTGSFRGLSRFKRNCTNFGYLIDKSNMKLMKWEDFENKGIGHWRFSCVMSFPWKPILSATGYTEYYFDEKSGKVSRHVEHWNVPKMALLKQIFRPSRVSINQ
ncbi:uncharacterized protein LOC111411712 isoform X2 [Olea europaea var. sylvestris]|uniref:NTF2-like domain-containing protein n=1 Tax=Olea europaea subsp. europaea TaxID=158383 RepID=A0A8S0SK47_OLEEU|nr:uncharacterized protein LOC111411712 isoform X2 [Olea europaea var. sylvestris]CAA2992988.1 Hypothetical predicted protein [Olea europaea subsp. europaea]